MDIEETEKTVVLSMTLQIGDAQENSFHIFYCYVRF